MTVNKYFSVSETTEIHLGIVKGEILQDYIHLVLTEYNQLYLIVHCAIVCTLDCFYNILHSVTDKSTINSSNYVSLKGIVTVV
jgi:hypothetical protein